MKERKRNRLKDYDYSASGYYFVTICTKNKEEWFGKIEDGKMILSPYGEGAKKFWSEMPFHFEGVKIDDFSVMPNHIHGIIIIERVGNAYMRSLQDRTKMLLPKVIQQYKAAVTRKISAPGNGSHFKWQKSFYEHVIRNEQSLNSIRQYIVNNPSKWELDIENKRGNSAHKSCGDYYGEIIEGKSVGNAYMRSLRESGKTRR